MENNNAVKIKKLNKSFGENIIFKDFEMSVEKDEHVGITGPSGCGKTTLLRMICGLDKDFSGEIKLTGKAAYVFQDSALFPWLNAKDNVKAAVSSDKDKKESDLFAKELLCSMGLAGDIIKYPSELSGGMQRRVALARALAFDCDIVLLDEPFSGLDEETKDSVSGLIKEYCINKTLIMVSHDTEELDKLTDRIIHIK